MRAKDISGSMAHICLFLILFVTTMAHAGFRRGNGGSVLICEQPQGKTYELLDIFEARARYHFTVQTAEGENEFQKAQMIIDRIARLNPNRRNLYTEWLKSFVTEAQYIDGLNIVGIPDVGVSYIPDGCLLKQMIAQVEPLTSFEKRYTIDLRIWNALDLDQRAASLVHELIYREAISFENQHNSSEPTRLMNAYIHSPLIQTTTLQDWIRFVQDLGFHRADAHGYAVKLNAFTDTSYGRHAKTPIYFYDEEHVQRAQIPYEFDFTLLEREYLYHCDSNLVDNEESSMLTFYSDGKIRDISFTVMSSRPQYCPNLLLITNGPTNFQAPVFRISFKKDGDLDFVSGMNNSNRSHEIPEMMDSLSIETKNLIITRNFRYTPAWLFVLSFEKNQPVFLQNQNFDSNTSSTYLKKDGERVSIPNNTVQKIF